ncbi:MAG: epoxyqueuosine reductase [Clostridia bacterium]|nr:epoxyqueuosine reductase [Clostridia bacterium]
MERLVEFFKSHNIEYYSVLDYAECREINSRLIEREQFTPRSVIMFVIPYYAGETVNLSRYAAAKDYHLYIRAFTASLISLLSELFPGSLSAGYGDHSPIDERHAALLSGLGILGDNGLIINEKYGSYIFIGDVITDIPPEKLGYGGTLEIKQCLHCGACSLACPTGILRGEGADCLSAITQRKGELTADEI